LRCASGRGRRAFASRTRGRCLHCASRVPGADGRERPRSCTSARQERRTEPALFAVRTVSGAFFVGKGAKSSRRRVFLCTFFEKSTKNTPTMPRSAACGLTLAAGDYSRICKQIVPAARAFSPRSTFPHSASGRNPCAVPFYLHLFPSRQRPDSFSEYPASRRLTVQPAISFLHRRDYAAPPRVVRATASGRRSAHRLLPFAPVRQKL